MRKFIHGFLIGAFFILLLGMLLAGFGAISYAEEGHVAGSSGTYQKIGELYAANASGAYKKISEGYVAGANGVYRKWFGSGSGWIRVETSPGVFASGLLESSDSLLRISGFTSSDGKTWIKPSVPPVPSGTGFAYETAVRGQLYRIYRPSFPSGSTGTTIRSGRVLSSPDGGVTWHDRGALPEQKYWMGSGDLLYEETPMSPDGSLYLILTNVVDAPNLDWARAGYRASSPNSTTGTLSWSRITSGSPAPSGNYSTVYYIHTNRMRLAGHQENYVRLGSYYYAPYNEYYYLRTTPATYRRYIRSTSVTSTAESNLLYTGSAPGDLGAYQWTAVAATSTIAAGFGQGGSPNKNYFYSTTNYSTYTKRTMPTLPGTMNLYPFTYDNKFWFFSYVSGTGGTAGIHIAYSTNLSSYTTVHIPTLNNSETWPSGTIGNNKLAAHFFKGKLYLSVGNNLFSGPIPK